MIQFLRGTQSQLNSSQQVFAAGQPVFESDTGQLKIGNGNSQFSSLPYVGSIFASEGGTGGSVDVSYTYVDPGLQYYDIGDNLRFIRFFRNMDYDTSYYTPSSSTIGSIGNYEFRYYGVTGSEYFQFKTLSPVSSYLYDTILDAKVRFAGNYISGASGIDGNRGFVGFGSYIGYQKFNLSAQTVEYSVVVQLSKSPDTHNTFSLQFDIITYK